MDILFPGSNLENKQQNYRFYDRNPYVDSKQHKFISQIMESVYMYLELSLKLKLLVRRRSPNDALCRVPIHAKQLFHCKDLCFRKI